MVRSCGPRPLPALGVVGQDSEDGGPSSRPVFLGGHQQPVSHQLWQGPRAIPSAAVFILGLARNRPSKRGEWSPLPASAALAAQAALCAAGQR